MHKLVKKYLNAGTLTFNSPTFSPLVEKWFSDASVPTIPDYSYQNNKVSTSNAPILYPSTNQGITFTPKPISPEVSPRPISNDSISAINQIRDNRVKEIVQENSETKLKGQGLKNFGKGVFNKGIGAFSNLYGFIPSSDKNINATDLETGQARGMIAQGLMQSGNPWLMAAGAAYGVMDKTGGFTDASEGLGRENDFWNGAASILVPGAGYFADKTEDYKMSGALASSSGYAGTRQSAQKAMKNAGAKLLFGRSKANDMIREAKRQDLLVQGILSDAQTDFTALNNMAEINGLRILNVTSGGNQMMRAARRGMRMLTQEEVAKKVAEIKSLRGGGKNKRKVNLQEKSKTYPTLEDFMKFIEEQGLLANDDYDYIRFYGDRPIFESWENDTTPNKHFTDKYKKPNHITFSEESVYSTPDNKGGKWYKDANGKTHFRPSEQQKQMRSYEVYKRYFDQNEPDVILDYDTTLKFQNGGQMNVIPEGALHARLHHMEDVNPDLKGQITKKGIPVVSEEEGGEITQQAEIEKEEIIFNKEVTMSLEELYKKYKEDPKPEYAIYAGRILAQLIMENTDDRTGLIDRVV